MASPVARTMIVPLIVASALFMENLDGTIITTALPQMAETFGTTPTQLSIGITAYVLSLAIFIPVSGWVADKFGARTIFCNAIAVFTIGSVLCGLCNNVAELAAARVLQGIGGAMMVPVGRLVMFRGLEKSEFVTGMAYLTVPALIGPILGPPVGGFITTFASWRWIFFLNVPVGIVGMFLVRRYIENYREADTPSLDVVGFLLTGVALACLVYCFDLIERPGSGVALILILFAGFGVAGLAAAWHVCHHDHPVIDPALLRIPTFSASVLGGAVFRVGTASLGFLLPVLFQVGMGMTAFVSGLLTVASTLGSFAMKLSASPILRRWGFRKVLFGNALISAAGVLVCIVFTDTTPYVVIFLILLVTGFLRSLQYTALNAMAFADIPTPRMSAATSFSSMFQQISNGLGVAFAAVVLDLVVVGRGESLSDIPVIDIQITLVIMTVITLASCRSFWKLPVDAGAEVSRHRPASS